MKKQSFLLVAGSILTLAACQNNPNEGANQTQIDSMVNVRVEEIRVQMMMQNDSIINMEAQRRADSIIAAMKGGSTGTISNNRRNTGTSTSTPETKTPTNPKEGRFNGEGNSNTDKKESRFNEDAAQKQKEENAKKKAERFNR